MKYFFTILLSFITTTYVVLRIYLESFYTLNDPRYIIVIIGAVFTGGIIDWFKNNFLERLKISRYIFCSGILLLLFMLILYWIEDLIDTAINYGGSPFYSLRYINHSLFVSFLSLDFPLNFMASILGVIVAVIIAPLIFRTNIMVSIVFLILGIWGQHGFSYIAPLFMIFSIVMYIGVGLMLKVLNKPKITL